MDSTFTILGLTAHAYGLCASAAAFVLLGGMAILARRRRMPAGLTGLFGLLGIPLGIVCARALYCVFHLSDFWETYENPWLMLRFSRRFSLRSARSTCATRAQPIVRSRPPWAVTTPPGCQQATGKCRRRGHSWCAWSATASR